MNYLQLNNIVKISSIILLLVFGFTFSHSELEQFVNDEATHSQHDFCKLVDDVALHLTKNSKLSISKSFELLVISTFQSVSFDSKNNLILHYNPDAIQKKYSKQAIYLQLSTFLI